MGYWIIIIISGIMTVICGYFAFMAFKSGDIGGVWLFIAFGFFFSVLPLGEIGKILTKERAPQLYDLIAGKKKEETLFVPQWHTLMIIVLAFISILVSIFISLFQHFFG
jgi:hypothetical protein